MSVKKYAPLSIVAAVALAMSGELYDLEGFHLKAYKDGAGVDTICDGMTYIPDIGPVQPGMELTKQECIELGAAVKQGFAKEVAKALKVDISIESMTAHAIFAYNIGPGGYRSSDALKHTNAGRYQLGCHAMANWYRSGGKDCYQKGSNCPGLITRREREIALCLRGS